MPDFDQRVLWNSAYRRLPHRAGESPGNLGAAPDGSAEPAPSDFAVRVAALLAARSSVLELGCGEGGDAAYFARLGHATTALDFSEVVVARNRRRHAGKSSPRFLVADLSEPLPFAADALDLVYARLSLQYFPDALTRRIFGEIWRVLMPQGLLCFMCKSTDDPLYGRGEQVGPDTFVLNVHVRHFFSVEYARDLLRAGFAAEAISSRRGELHGHESAFVEAIARKAV